jgi:hypothetical protein
LVGKYDVDAVGVASRDCAHSMRRLPFQLDLRKDLKARANVLGIELRLLPRREVAAFGRLAL